MCVLAIVLLLDEERRVSGITQGDFGGLYVLGVDDELGESEAKLRLSWV